MRNLNGTETIRKFMNRPIIAGVGITITYFVLMLIWGKIEVVFGLPDGFRDIMLIICGIATYVWYIKTFKDELAHNVKAKTKLYGFVLGIPIIVFVSITILAGIMGKQYDVVLPIVVVGVIGGIRAGVCEEIVLRGLFSSNMMRLNHKSEAIIKNAVIPSIVFGLIHLVNLTRGAGIVSTCGQIISATGIGLLLCAIFIRVGSVVPGIILHAAIDSFSYITGNMLLGPSGDYSLLTDDGSPTSTLIRSTAIFIICTTFALIYLRKKKHDSIIKMYQNN